MSSSVAISQREAVPVSIGSITLWCEEFKAEGSRIFSEAPSVSGDDIITNSAPKAMKLSFSGRISGGASPLAIIADISYMLRNNVSFSTGYRGLSFTDCRIQSFRAEDKGDDFIYASITLITPAPAAVNEVTE